MSQNQSAKKFNIFIAYAHQGTGWIRELTKALRDRGLSVWLDEDGAQLGEEWGRKTRDALRNSSSVVFLVEQGAANSNWLALELGMVLAAGKPIIPVVDPDLRSEEIPGPIRRRPYLKREDPRIVAEEIAEAVAA
jgi:hypothetical protein